MIQEITRSIRLIMRKCMILQDNNKCHISFYSKEVASFGFVCTSFSIFANDGQIIHDDSYHYKLSHFKHYLLLGKHVT